MTLPSQPETPAPAEPWRRIAYKLARHLDAASRTPAGAWSLRGQAILVELQKMDAARFSREIAGEHLPSRSAAVK